MLCKIDRGPLLCGHAPELVLGEHRVAGLDESAMLVVAEAWEELNAEVERKAEAQRSAEGDADDLRGCIDDLEREKTDLIRENERYVKLLEKHGIEPKE